MIGDGPQIQGEGGGEEKRRDIGQHTKQEREASGGRGWRPGRL